MSVQTWIYGLIVYFTLITVFIGLLGYSGLLVNSSVNVDSNPAIHSNVVQVYQATDYLIDGVPVCVANGSINFEEPDTLLFTFDATDVTLSSECTTYCRNETSWFIDALSCPGLCANITDASGVEHIGCAKKDDRWNFLTAIVGFFFFGIEMGLPAYIMVIIRTIFVYLPLLFFTLGIYYSIRSGSG